MRCQYLNRENRISILGGTKGTQCQREIKCHSQSRVASNKSQFSPEDIK